MENTSGQGKMAVVPPEIDKWNWGAFLMNWIWGIGNRTYIALLMFVPLANVVMPFVLGAKGSAWAWRNKRWESVEHFRRVQRRWAICGVTIIVLMIAAVILGITLGLKSAEAYKLGVRELHQNTQAVSLLGPPVHTGIPTGSIRVSGPDGFAHLEFSAQGKIRTGTVYLEATKELGQWKIRRAVLEMEGTGERIDLAVKSRSQ